MKFPITVVNRTNQKQGSTTKSRFVNFMSNSPLGDKSYADIYKKLFSNERQLKSDEVVFDVVG